MTKQEIEIIWRKRLEDAQAKYKTAKDEFSVVFNDHIQAVREGITSDPSLAIRQARQRETAALQEYMDILRTFMDLILHGKIPDTQK